MDQYVNDTHAQACPGPLAATSNDTRCVPYSTFRYKIATITGLRSLGRRCHPLTVFFLLAMCVRSLFCSYVKPSGAAEIDMEAEEAVAHPHKDKLLPLVPSVAILFRCCDILVMLSDQYGFIQWKDILARIPNEGTITTIYILTEAAGYNNCRYFVACQQISKALAMLLSERYPAG